jgi:protein phosphatase
MNISIIIPTYNAEKYLPNLLEKIKNQSIKECELIIIDSSSKDNTVQIAKQFTDNVIVLRGNHEPPRDLIPYPHDFPNELVMRFGYEKGLAIYNEFLELFNLMPHVAFSDEGIAFMHGGLPTVTYGKVTTIFEYFLGRNERESKEVLEEILWNDPIEANIVSTPSPRGAGNLFGVKVTEWFTRRFKFKLVVRGHEPIENGYKLNHKGRVLTLFSRLGPPYFNQQAAYLVLRTDIREWDRRIKDFIRFIQPQ